MIKMKMIIDDDADDDGDDNDDDNEDGMGMMVVIHDA